MNIYLISQDHNDNCDTYDSAVVVAATEDDARKISPGEGARQYAIQAWCAPEFVMVKLIGTTDLPAGTVICASFHAC